MAKNQVDIKSKLEAKAYAWYYVTFHPSERADEPGGESMISFPWTVDDHLCDIAIRNSGRVKTLEDVYRGSKSNVNTSYQRPSSTRRNGSNSSQIERIVNFSLPGEEPASDGGISRIRTSLRRNGI